MKQQNNGNGTITIWVDGSELRTMEANELAVYHTPGTGRVYIASGPQFRDDVLVATTYDFLTELGYDSSDGVDDTEVAELTVKVV